ncbi:MAG: methionine adenosyltransferase [Clostridiales bacterium]|nr:methionine adenosyltransferase [Clostridiales bacterium]
MNEKNIRLVTAESVRAGHPDKFCDQVADAILDAHFRQDPNARVAVEVFATAGKMIIGGEVTSKAEVDCGRIVADAIDRIGYTMCDLCEDSHDPLELEIRIHDQSPDISAAVGAANLGAGDQGIVVGYATNETDEYLPLPVVLAHRICKRLDELKPQTPWLGADGKAQVTVAYENDVSVAVTAVVVSLQHDAEMDRKGIRRFIGKEVLGKVLPRELLKEDTSILVNPSGKFTLGGPAADTGLTGRKLAVDQYGPVAHIGGGALSGKDPTKVDRSGAYSARWVAKNIVAAGMAKRCEVQIAYAIGRSEPVSVAVNTFGTGVIPDSRIEAAVRAVFDLTPAGIIHSLRLNRPIYSKLACYGHFGRTELALPWEEINRKYELLSAALKQSVRQER